MINKIFDSVKNIKSGNLLYDEYNKEQQSSRRNEFVVLIKPECFKVTDSMYDIVNAILTICENNKVTVNGFKAFNGNYAKEMAYIENEYYVLNRSARYGFDHIPFAYQSEIIRKYPECTTISAYGFLYHSNGDYTAKTLEEVTETRLSDKIGNGTYILPIEYHGEKYAVINPFHPEQINHFYNSKHITVALFCQSDMDYSMLANHCIGNYVPERAEKSSIRYHLYNNQGKYGLTINRLFNGVHISPSPLEGMFGYYRYSRYYRQDLSRSSLYRRIVDMRIRPDQIFALIENPTFSYNGELVDIFGLCESKNSEDILSILSEIDL